MTASTTPLPHRIVVGVDGSPSSTAALAWAARQAALTGSTLEAVTAWEWPTSYGWSAPIPTDYDAADDARRILDDALKVVRDEYPDLVVRPDVVEGHPAPVLTDASRGADLLVVGSRGHGEFVGMLIGSTSGHCVGHARCPVVVVRGPA